ncbi:MAG: tetratricopeptide repeat protein [Deltaproteobacteria bacterium]|nr:tetratricopeptide repeat protein [Deltaproteobacteria bacterium]
MTNRTVAMLVSLFGAIGASSSGWPQQRVVTTPSWKDAHGPLEHWVAQAKAGKTRLLILVQRTASCEKSCQAIVRTLTNRRLVGLLPLRYFANAGEGCDVAQRYNVVEFPTLLLLDHQARELGRATVAEQIPALISGKLSYAALQTQLKRQPTVSTRLALGRMLAAAGLEQRATGVLAPLSDCRPRQPCHPAALWALGDLLYLRSLGAKPRARQLLQMLLSRFAKSDYAQLARLALAASWLPQHGARAALWLRQVPALAAAELLGRAGQPRQALAYAQRAVREQPSNPAAHATLAEVLGRLGKQRAARRSIEHALKRDAKNPQLRLLKQQIVGNLLTIIDPDPHFLPSRSPTPPQP